LPPDFPTNIINTAAYAVTPAKTSKLDVFFKDAIKAENAITNSETTSSCMCCLLMKFKMIIGISRKKPPQSASRNRAVIDTNKLVLIDWTGISTSVKPRSRICISSSACTGLSTVSRQGRYWHSAFCSGSIMDLLPISTREPLSLAYGLLYADS
jgi:hypothetical protein